MPGRKLASRTQASRKRTIRLPSGANFRSTGRASPLAKVSTPRVDLRDPAKRYHIYTVTDLQKLTPDFDYSVFFKDVGVRPFDTLNVGTPDFFKGLNDLIASQPVDAWKSYMRWPRSVTLAPIGMPVRRRNCAIERLARVTMGR